MRNFALPKRPLGGVLALIGMAASLLTLLPAAHADNLFGAGNDPAVNAPPDPEPAVGRAFVGPGGAPIPVAPALTYWYYDEDGPGVIKFTATGGNGFAVRL